MASIKVTKQKIYDAKVVEVDASGLRRIRKNLFDGTIEIVINETEAADVSSEERKTITGEHGSKDYEAEYGFIIV